MGQKLKQDIASAKEENIKESAEKVNRERVSKETNSKSLHLSRQRKEADIVYNNFKARFKKKIKIASDHEAKQKYAVKAPYDMENNNKAEISTKRLKKERATKVEQKGKKEINTKDAAEKNEKSVSAEK